MARTIYYLVDDGGVYNVISSDDFDSKVRYINNPSYTIDDFEIIGRYQYFDAACKDCDRMNNQ